MQMIVLLEVMKHQYVRILSWNGKLITLFQIRKVLIRKVDRLDMENFGFQCADGKLYAVPNEELISIDKVEIINGRARGTYGQPYYDVVIPMKPSNIECHVIDEKQSVLTTFFTKKMKSRQFTLEQMRLQTEKYQLRSGEKCVTISGLLLQNCGERS